MDSDMESAHLLDSFLFPKIFQAFRMAIQPSKLIIAFLGLVVICLAGRIMDLNKTVVTTPLSPGLAGDTRSGASQPSGVTELLVHITNPDAVERYIAASSKDREFRGVFSTLWGFGTDRFHGALRCLFRFDLLGVAANIADCFQAMVWAVRYHFMYSIIFFAIALAVMSITGGAICRIAAMQFAVGERPRLTEAVRYSTKRFTSYFTAPLAPACIIAFIGLFIFVVGLMGNIPYAGELVMAIGMPLVLFAGVLIAVVLIGALAGFNLMFPAVAYENSDSFDSISRSFSYVYAKPWRMGFYTATATAYGAVSYIFVRFFAFLMLWISYRFLQLGVLRDNAKLKAIWPEPSFPYFVGAASPTPGNWSAAAAAFLVYLCILAVIGLVVSFVISFYFSANTIIYSLMRNRVDNTELSDIYTYSTATDIESTTPEFEAIETESQPDLDAEQD
ncbi:MAG: hypothetical protein JSU70_12230 [Phycisphaerales bacterium]|nr:MAG: hypothetical protein JSU70_12230 [Phycisphaerales bacterium]